MDDEERRRPARGDPVAYVPQDTATALNPALRIGTQLREVLEAHGQTNAKANDERLAEMMREVALPDDPAYLRRYPHQLSGGQQQRVGLAMAFANRPSLIVLDEPTTGLDVTTQSTVLATVRDLAVAHGVAALYVSHDLAVVAAVATPRRGHVRRPHRRAGPADELFESSGPPLHPPAGRCDPAAGRRTEPGRHPRPRTVAGQATGGLRVRAALRPAHRRVRQSEVPDRSWSRPTTRRGASGPTRSSSYQQTGRRPGRPPARERPPVLTRERRGLLRHRSRCCTRST